LEKRKTEKHCGTVQNREINEGIARDMGLHFLPKSAVEYILDYTQAAMFLNGKGYNRNPCSYICSEFCDWKLKRII